MKKKQPPIPVDQRFAPSEEEQAYLRFEPRFEALRSEELLPIRISVLRTVGRVLCAERRIAELVPDLRAHLPTFPVVLIEELRPMALALLHIDGQPRPARTENKTVRQLVAEATPM